MSGSKPVYVLAPTSQAEFAREIARRGCPVLTCEGLKDALGTTPSEVLTQIARLAAASARADVVAQTDPTEQHMRRANIAGGRLAGSLERAAGLLEMT